LELFVLLVAGEDYFGLRFAFEFAVVLGRGFAVLDLGSLGFFWGLSWVGGAAGGGEEGELVVGFCVLSGGGCG
jgi:hypothetical protein